MDSKSVKADDIEHVLRDGVALLPGCRDREGRALMLFPSKEQTINSDNIRNLLLYLYTVTEDVAREKGFIMVVDMRGRQTWTNVRPMLKAISNTCESETIFAVLIIKPDKFWEKQKAQISLGSWKFEVQMVGADQLSKYLDPSQLPRQMGGTFPYDHDDWLETRLELERWIWKVSEVMRGLEGHRRAVCEAEQPIDVKTSQVAIQQHSSTKNAILAIPIDRIQQEANVITSRIKNPVSGVHNPDLMSVLPNMGNLINSLLELKTKVFKSWERRHAELQEICSLKLFEHDVDEILDWVQSHSKGLMSRMGDIGSNEAEATERLKELEEFEATAKNNEVNVGHVTANARRILSTGTPQHRTRAERSGSLIVEQWGLFHSLLARRRAILTAAVQFFWSSVQYFSRLPSWLDQPGFDPSSVDGSSAEQLESAIRSHKEFWNDVEEIYAQAVGHGSELSSSLRAAEAEDQQGVARDQNARLARAHKQLHAAWRDRQVRLHSLLALTAFQTDTQRVIEWLDQHGDPYLRINTRIGDSQETATLFQKNQMQFAMIAKNTYANAEKLFDASRTIIESGVVEGPRMNALLGDLRQRLDQFTVTLEARSILLNNSVLFHTHFNELMKWYSGMEKKYEIIDIGRDIDFCERAKEDWVFDSDGTADAYSTVMSEGTRLINELQIRQNLLEVDYSGAVAHVQQLMAHINQTNQRLVDRWASRRTHLHIALTYAHFERDIKEVLDQIANWNVDMKGMLSSPTFVDNAHKVQPFHKANTAQVKMAIKNIKRGAQELLQAIHGHKLDDLKTNRGQGESVLQLIREHLKNLEASEHMVLRVASDTAARIESARKQHHVSILAHQMRETFKTEMKRMYSMGGIPKNYEESAIALADFEEFRQSLEAHELSRSSTSSQFYKLSNELIQEGIADRNAVVELNEMIVSEWRRLVGLVEERHKLLKAAVGCYKTYYSGVVPILEQLEREYGTPSIDWCLTCPLESPSPQDRAGHMSDLLSKHSVYKDRFLKGCTYAQKTSEVFLKYIERAQVSEKERDHHTILVNNMKSALRERQSTILDLWTQKKKHLDRCQEYVLLDASRIQLLDWLMGEGKARLTQYQRHSKQMKETQRAEILEDFGKFKILVKEKRSDVQTILQMASSIQLDAKEHKMEIENCAKEVKSSYEAFSRQVSDCQAALNGGRAVAVRDELSLDRHSDNSVEERMEKERAESQLIEQMRKMREPMRELIKTENDYIEDLRRCVEVYIRDFDKVSSSPSFPFSLRDKRNSIFGNIEKIFEFHANKFVHELTKYENDPEAVGCSFNVWVDLMSELYTEYCVNKEQNNQVLTLQETVDFFKSVREKHELEVNNDIGSLLIKPVQRITRYRLIMSELMKNCSGNLDEIQEAFEVVKSIPRRVNDIIHLNCLDRDKDKLGVLGPFVMQDSLTVWEPKSYFKKGKERQVFLFELAIVFAKKLEAPSKTLRYVTKGKPVPLGEVSVVEHVEGDVCRFGLRVGTTASNENRTDLKATSEHSKIAWVRKIRELTSGLLPLGLGVGLDSSSLTSSTARSVSTRSNVSSSSGDRLSRDAESLSMAGVDAYNRHSLQSDDSQEQSSDHWLISADFEPTAEGQLAVRRGDRVEYLEDQPSDVTDWVMVSLVDDVSRTGLVPSSILLPDQPSSSTDRPEAGGGGTVVKRKSLRRIFANSSGKESHRDKEKERDAEKDRHLPSSSTPTALPTNNTVCSVLSSEPSTPNPDNHNAAAALIVDDEPVEGLPPPMEDLSLSNAAALPDDSSSAAAAMSSDSTTVRECADEEVPEKAEKSPEELARFKRHYVLMELVETEQDYVRDLTSVVDGYIANLEQMELPEELQGKDKIIFANIAQILDFHKNNFLKEIEKCLDNYEAAGAAFVKYERRLHTLYVKYCQNKPKSDYLVSQDEFEVFFADTKLKLGHKVALCDLLIKPVQRIMKYQLLLKDILKFTERAKDSTVQLNKALAVMHVVPKACDDMMQVGRLQNFDGSLNAQGRLIYQGTLSICEVVGNNSQKPKDRRIFLFEQSAIIADHIPPKKDFGNPTYIFKNQIMVNKMQFQKSVSSDEPLKFMLGSADPSQPNFVAIAQTQEEKDEWVRQLEDMQDQQKRMLEQLVNPKKYPAGGADLGMGSLSLGGGPKSPAASPRSPAPTSSATVGKKAESPKKEKKEGKGLFSFGKKPSAKSPTSPPPVGKLK